VVAALQRALTAEMLTLYPEYSAARPKIAAHFRISPDELVLTNGTDEAIQVLVNTFIGRDDEVFVPEPSYAMYRFYSELAGARVSPVLGPRTRAALIANPNNPTGSWMERAECLRLAAARPDVLFLFDEAYFEFSGITVLDQLGAFPNIFVSRTFSKAYGMAAMRMGCLMSSAENVAWMRKGQSPYSVNLLAVIAAVAAIEDREYVDHYVRDAIAARERIVEGLGAMGIKCYPSKANFVLFEAGERAIEIRDLLRDRGILVRDRSYEIAGAVRVTAGTPDQANRFLGELKEIW
jgi:histidinol-phosphate aminotransferase